MPAIGARAYSLEQVRLACKQGYPYAEVSLLDPETVASQIRELQELKDQYGIYYLAHYPNEDNPVDPGILKERFLPKMKRLFKLSQKLGIKKGTLHFWMDKRWAQADLLSAKRELLSQLTTCSGREGVQLCLENLTERYDSFAEVFESIPELRMTLDMGHGELLSKINTSLDFIKHLFPRIEHVHAHDNHGGKGVEDDLHLPLGEGRVDYARILSLLKKKKYSSTITMEVSPDHWSSTREKIESYFHQIA